MEEIIKNLNLKIESLTWSVGELNHEAATCKKLGYHNEGNVIFIKLALVREERNYLEELLKKLEKLKES